MPAADRSTNGVSTAIGQGAVYVCAALVLSCGSRVREIRSRPTAGDLVTVVNRCGVSEWYHASSEQIVALEQTYRVDDHRSSGSWASGAPTFLGFVASDTEVCGLTEDDVVYCWGMPSVNFDEWESAICPWHSDAPVPVLTDVAELYACDDLFCARLRNGAIDCWGIVGEDSLAPTSGWTLALDVYACAPTEVRPAPAGADDVTGYRVDTTRR